MGHRGGAAVPRLPRQHARVRTPHNVGLTTATEAHDVLVFAGHRRTATGTTPTADPRLHGDHSDTAPRTGPTAAQTEVVTLRAGIPTSTDACTLCHPAPSFSPVTIARAWPHVTSVRDRRPRSPVHVIDDQTATSPSRHVAPTRGLALPVGAGTRPADPATAWTPGGVNPQRRARDSSSSSTGGPTHRSCGRILV